MLLCRAVSSIGEKHVFCSAQGKRRLEARTATQGYRSPSDSVKRIASENAVTNHANSKDIANENAVTNHANGKDIANKNANIEHTGSKATALNTETWIKMIRKLAPVYIIMT